MEIYVRVLSLSAFSQRNILIFKAVLNDLPSSRVRIPLPGLFSSASFSTQHRSALLFPCPLTRNSMGKHPTEGSQEVLKNGTLVLQPLRTSLGPHINSRFVYLNSFCFQLTRVLAIKKKVWIIWNWPFLKWYTMVFHRLGNSGTKEITFPLWRKELSFWEGICNFFKGQTWGEGTTCFSFLVFILFWFGFVLVSFCHRTRVASFISKRPTMSAWKKGFHFSSQTRLDK